MKYKIDEEDLKDIIKLKTLANNDHKFKRYVYNITEEEQKQYGFDFIGEYSYEPNPNSYNLNTTYRNSIDKCVYIKSKDRWQLFLKDGNDGKTIAMGGGMGFNDVDRLITERLQSYSPTTSGGTTSGGTYYGLNGILPLYTSATQYTVYHDNINYIQMAPILSLNIPSPTSLMILATVCNRLPTQFDIILSNLPTEDNYSISWFIPNTNGAEGTTTIVSTSEVIVSGTFANMSGSNLTEILNSIDNKLNNINYLENYDTVDFETLVGVPEIMYVGKINKFDSWYVRKVVTDAIGNITQYHANISNNPSILTYTNSWNNRTTLVYGNLEDLIFV